MKRAQLIAKWNVAAYLCVGLASILVLLITAWGAYVDFHEVRVTFLQGKVGSLRSHAVRTAAMIQARLDRPNATLQAAVSEDDWLRQYWETWVPKDPSRLYAAVVDNSGVVVLHTNPKCQGMALDKRWYLAVLPEGGDDVVQTDSRALTDEPAYDIRVPILKRDHEIGAYHSGLDPDWFTEALHQKYRSTWTRWIGIFSCVLMVVVIAGVSLHQIVRRTIKLREEIELARVKQLAELGHLAASIAHEIRNPINVIRLNLHALHRLRKGAAGEAGEQELITVIAEANREIERIEGMVRIMLGYARPDRPVEEDVELRTELEATASFLRPILDRDRVTICMQFPPVPLYAHVDRNRFRQVMLNLLTNAKEAVGGGGRVEIGVCEKSDFVEIAVTDNGPGVLPENLERIFEPFYSTKELGTGLGLALVKRFVEEAGGSVVCENHGGGARFRIMLPKVIQEPAAA